MLQEITKFILNFCLLFAVPFNNQRVATISRDTANIYPKDYTLFSLWLLNGVAMLHGFNENGSYIGSSNGRVRENAELLDSLLKAFTSGDISEQNLRVSLLIIQSLLLTWWPKKCELVMSFWECFHKKLNSTFFVNGAAPSSLAVAGYALKEFVSYRILCNACGFPNSDFYLLPQ